MGLWEYSFRGACVTCRRWFELTTEDAKEAIRTIKEMAWWDDCPFCSQGFGAKKTVAFRFVGGHDIDFGREQAERAATASRSCD